MKINYSDETVITVVNAFSRSEISFLIISENFIGLSP